jgi:hypothetical protein
MFEREAALAAVAATVEATRRNEYSVLFVLGEAGLGKTSLIAWPAPAKFEALEHPGAKRCGPGYGGREQPGNPEPVVHLRQDP